MLFVAADHLNSTENHGVDPIVIVPLNMQVVCKSITRRNPGTTLVSTCPSSPMTAVASFFIFPKRRNLLEDSRRKTH